MADELAKQRLPVETVAIRRVVNRHPSPKLTVEEMGSKVALGNDHPDQNVGTALLMQAIGTTDYEFLDGLMSQLVNAGTQGKKADARGPNFMLAVIKGIEPRDEVEAMLAAQMAAVHMASMTFARRLAHVENIPQQDAAERAFNKLVRTFAMQVEALKRYRTGGEQKVTVQHVNVSEGGQAIVGNVSQGRGAEEKGRNNPMKSRDALPMHVSPRCKATSKRTGVQCQAPAVKGHKVCRFHGAGGGAPKGNRNAWRHGKYSRKNLKGLRLVFALARLARKTIDEI